MKNILLRIPFNSMRSNTLIFQRDQGKITLEEFRTATVKKNAKNYNKTVSQTTP